MFCLFIVFVLFFLIQIWSLQLPSFTHHPGNLWVHPGSLLNVLLVHCVCFVFFFFYAIICFFLLIQIWSLQLPSLIHHPGDLRVHPRPLLNLLHWILANGNPGSSGQQLLNNWSLVFTNRQYKGRPLLWGGNPTTVRV